MAPSVDFIIKRIKRMRVAVTILAMFILLLVLGLIGVAFQSWTSAEDYRQDVVATDKRLDEADADLQKVLDGLAQANKRLGNNDLAPVPIPEDVNEGEIQEPEFQDEEHQDSERQDPERQDPEDQEEEVQEPEIQDEEVDDPDPNSLLNFEVRTQGCNAPEGEYIYDVQPAWERGEGTITLVFTCTTRPFPTPPSPEATP